MYRLVLKHGNVAMHEAFLCYTDAADPVLPHLKFHPTSNISDPNTINTCLKETQIIIYTKFDKNRMKIVRVHVVVFLVKR